MRRQRSLVLTVLGWSFTILVLGGMGILVIAIGGLALLVALASVASLF